MKKAILIPAALFFVTTMLMSSRPANAQIGFGIKAFPNFSNVSSKLEGAESNASKLLAGGGGGVYVNLPLPGPFYIQPSLFFEQKGSKAKDVDYQTRLNYITLPVDFLFKPDLPVGGSWIIGAGPYVGYGISGKVSGNVGGGEVSGDPFKAAIEEGEALLKRFDAGANLQLGYEMSSGFNIGLYGELGLANFLNHGDSKNYFHNTSFALTLGYTFLK